jgi:hypothetical protein
MCGLPKEVTLAEQGQVIGQLAPERSAEPLRTILPPRSRRDPELTNTKIVTRRSKTRAEDPVAIVDEELERAVLTERLDKLLCRLLGVRMGGHVHVEDPPPFERQQDEDLHTLPRDVADERHPRRGSRWPPARFRHVLGPPAELTRRAPSRTVEREEPAEAFVDSIEESPREGAYQGIEVCHVERRYLRRVRH